MIPNILLIEDDHLDIENAKRTLSKANFLHNLYVAKNGEEALNMLMGQNAEKIDPLPEIILLDLNMPRMNGFEFLSILRTDERFSHVKIFIITTSADDLDKELCHKYGVSGYIEKPFKLTNSNSKDAFNLYVDLINLKHSSGF
jgi:CheY-like chemotaxis protein